MTTSSDSRARDRARRTERGRAPWLVGLGVSGAIHLVALLLYSGITFIPSVTVTPPSGRESTLDAIQLLDVVVAAPEEEPEEEAEAEEVEPAEPEAAAPVPVAPTPARGAEEDEEEGEAVGEYPPAADRLRVGAVDPRLYPTDFREQYLGTEELLQLDLDVAVALLRDSLDAASSRSADALDWTWTDSDGKRWGVSPGKIHLGDVTLPLPSSWGMGTSPWNREAELERARRNGEIDRQAITGLIIETWEERFRAIRERADRARREQNGVPPDTTSGGR